MKNNIIKKQIWKQIIKQIYKRNGTVIFYTQPEKKKAFNLNKRIKKETELHLSDSEACQIYMTVKSIHKVKGDVAEAGVYKGGSAKIICESKGEKTLHLFDTFKGLPEIGNFDDKEHFKKGQYNATCEEVKDYLKDYNRIIFHKGLFPETAESVKNKTFSFVHLDLDLYQSTKDALNFFYPRMNEGAIMITHDYSSVPGVKKAFDEFFKNKITPIIQLSGSQCIIVKIN